MKRIRAQTSVEFIILAVIAIYLVFFLLSLAIDVPDMTQVQSNSQTRLYYSTLPLAILDVYVADTQTEFLVYNQFKEPVLIHTAQINDAIYSIDQTFLAGEKAYLNVSTVLTTDTFLWFNYTLVWSNITKNISYDQKYPLN